MSRSPHPVDGLVYTALVPMRWSDMDAYGHVNNVQFLTYVEEARIEMLRPLDAVQPSGAAGGAYGIVVAHSEITYRRPLVHRHEPVPIDVWVTAIGGASFDLAYLVHDGAAAAGRDGRTAYATASSRMVPYDFTAERPRRLSAAERAYLQRHLGPPLPVTS